MITLETIRTALSAADPYEEMDQLVVAEMASGRKVQEIFDAINPVLEEVLDTPGLSEHGEEAILGTIDKLTGGCHESQCYYDPPNLTLPTEEEIAKLPRWARVAFAARCARRVLPLPILWRPDTSSHTLWATQRAVAFVERSASHLETEENSNEILSSLREIDGKGFGPVTDSIVALLTAKLDNGTSFDGYVVVAARAATVDAQSVADIQPIIRRDFDHLASLAKWRYWTDDTPVPPEVFGPLWPEGPPKGWPADPDVSQRTELALEFFPRERAVEMMAEDDIVHLFNMMNRYHIIRCGVRLTLEQFHSRVPALVLVEG